jgi:cytochrome P450
LGSGLLTATTANGLWKRKRKMITPAFHFNIIQRYVPIFCEHATRLADQWLEEAKEGKPINIVNNVTTAALGEFSLVA